MSITETMTESHATNDEHHMRYQNRSLRSQSPMGWMFEKSVGIPLNAIEAVGSYLIVRPMNWALRHFATCDLSGHDFILTHVRISTGQK
jgi:hypothetical protein